MASLISQGNVGWGLQLPVQAQSKIFVQPWEAAAGPAEIARIASAADRAGATYVAVCDHVAIPSPADQTMGTTWYDTIATLGWLAAQTSSVHLLSHVYVLPYRPALMIAKSFVTLDRLSDGRAILGVGAGHVEAEFAALGVDFESRGRVASESLTVIRAAFKDEYVEVPDGRVDSGDSIRVGVAPRPVCPGGPPIWVGGSSSPAIRRAALLGDGWLPQGPPKMGMKGAIDLIRELRAEAGLPAQFDFGVTGGPIFIGDPTNDANGIDLPEYTMSGTPAELIERIGRLTNKGINQLQFQFIGRDASQVCDQIERFGAEVAPMLSGTG